MNTRIALQRNTPALLFVFMCNLFVWQNEAHALDPNKRITQYDIRVYKARDGLPMNDLKDVFQSSDGYIWIASQEGVARFDGVRFKIFRRSEYPGLGEDFVWDIDEDWNGHLWFATQGGGVSRFDGKQFTNYTTKDGLLSKVVTHVLVNNQKKYILFATDKGETYYRNNGFEQDASIQDTSIREATITKVFKNSDEKLPEYIPGELIVSGGSIYKIASSFDLPTANCLRASGEIFFRGEKGWLYEFVDKEFLKSNSSRLPSAMVIRALHEDHDGNLWFATEGQGIYRYNYIHDSFDSLTTENGLSTDNNYFNRIMEDNEGGLWFAGGGGLVKLSDNKFVTFGRNEGLRNHFGHTVCEDSDGNIWMGFRDGSIARLESQKLVVFKETDALGELLSLTPSRGTGVWVGHSRGLSFLKNNRLIHTGLVPLKINALFENQRGHVWVGGNVGNLAYFDGTKTEIYRTLLPATGASDIICIMEKKNQEVWFGTRKNGLFKLHDNKPGKSIQPIRIGQEDGFYSDGVNALYEDAGGVLWIGSDGEGLYRFADGDFFQYTSADHKLAFDRLFSILEDDLGHLWFSGNRGVFSVSKDSLNRLANVGAGTLNCQSYNHLDGMREAECNGRRQPVAWKSRDGRLWFAAIAGIVSVDPLNMPVNAEPPPVHIETIIANGDSVIEIDSSPLQLGAHNRDLEFQYTACSFTVPERVKFKYQLEGYDSEWIYSDTRRAAFYTNLGKGDYIFRVQACNNDGVWNKEGAFLAISIPPFWWETWWSYAIYGLTFLGFLYGLQRYEFSRQQLKHSLELEHTQAEKLHELDRMKSRFFANISHEFRTPLTLILGPLQRLRAGRYAGDRKRQYAMMERNGKRLLRLINQLLDLSKLGAGKLKLEARKGDIIYFMKGVLSSFESLARERKISLDFEAISDGGNGSSPLMVYFDSEKFEKAIINLVANALKFTPEGGRINVRLSTDLGPHGRPDYLQISVIDTGTGIQAEHLPYVFDQFYQVGTSEKDGDVGSGIGLALTKELVELHKGTIEVTNEINSGTEFLISLPLGKDHLHDDDIIEKAEPDACSNVLCQEYEVDPEFTNEKSQAGSKQKANSDAALSVLVIDDNKDMRDYLRDALNGDYQVLEAADGEEGLRTACDILPDIVVSDVMMPKVDGFEFCRQLKTNELTSHIPVILLTAKSSDKSKIEGLETGADAYLTKPFSHEELNVRLRKLIEQRKKLQEKFRKQITVVKVEPEKIDFPSRDQEFLDRAKAVVLNNMEDSDFSAEKFAAEMHISKVHLNRKLKALIAEHTSNFVLLIRLQRAAQMLEANSGNISEVAYSVGFNNLSHFNRAFKKQFGATPSAYKKQLLKSSQ